MMDVVWIIACIRNPSLVDAISEPYVEEFWADPAAWDAKYRAIDPMNEGAIDLLAADILSA